MPLLADVAVARHFSAADSLHCTLWRQLPFIARALGEPHCRPSHEEHLGRSRLIFFCNEMQIVGVTRLSHNDARQASGCLSGILLL